LKLLLDTTYLLPAIGISIKGLPKDSLIKLKRKGHQISISSISIFELSAKSAKHIADGALPPERVLKGIRAIVHNDDIETIPTHDDTILLSAFRLRKILSDFIDCLILSSAINRCDSVVTEDSDIQNLKEDGQFKELLKSTNPRFKIHTLIETL